MILRDVDLVARFHAGQPIVTPFLDQSVRDGVISYGLSHTGYDIRIGSKFKVFRSPQENEADKPDEIDPKRFGSVITQDVTIPVGQVLYMSPLSYALGYSLEYFSMPNDVTGVALGKSTYARCGLIVNVTPLEPGWRGHLTIELFNATKRHLVIYPNEGIAQILFFQASGEVGLSYGEKSGKYQDQADLPVAAIVERIDQLPFDFLRPYIDSDPKD